MFFWIERVCVLSVVEQVVTDQFQVELQGRRIPGRRVKHRVRCNWIKMYDRGPVLRVETAKPLRNDKRSLLNMATPFCYSESCQRREEVRIPTRWSTRQYPAATLAVQPRKLNSDP
jgi:hypothetical protein